MERALQFSIFSLIGSLMASAINGANLQLESIQCLYNNLKMLFFFVYELKVLYNCWRGSIKYIAQVGFNPLFSIENVCVPKWNQGVTMVAEKSKAHNPRDKDK